jgi:SAM-dependent methyltransferase
MPNVSDINADVFTWLPHGLSETENVDEAFKALVKDRPMSKFFVGNDNFLDGKTAVDAGCGRGLKTCALAASGPKRVLGIDISEPGIEAARGLADRLSLDNVTFANGYLEDIGNICADNGFDKVDFIFNSFNIHHVTNWQQQISDFSNVLSVGGVLYINWTTLGRGWANYLWKNRIAFALGHDRESRLRIGKRLFAWWDKRYFKSEIDWDAYYADRYAALYVLITAGQLERALRRAGFEIVQTEPPMNVQEYCWTPDQSRVKRTIAKIINAAPFMSPFLTLLLRIRQFLKPGDIRAFVCVKTNRINDL